jgi:hypothetical protein
LPAGSVFQQPRSGRPEQLQKLSQIGKQGIPSGVEQDLGGLDVSVDDPRLAERRAAVLN